MRLMNDEEVLDNLVQWLTEQHNDVTALTGRDSRLSSSEYGAVLEKILEFSSMITEDTEQADVEGAIAVIEQCGMIDGAHHKQWVLDQVVRALKGKNYDRWLKDYNDPDYTLWDEGIAP